MCNVIEKTEAMLNHFACSDRSGNLVRAVASALSNLYLLRVHDRETETVYTGKIN